VSTNVVNYNIFNMGLINIINYNYRGDFVKKASLILVATLVISISLAGCGSKTMSNNTSKTNVASNKIQQTSNETANQSNKVNALNFETVNMTYINKKVKINYPQITNFSDANKQSQINELIKNDILNDHQKDVTNLVKAYFKNDKEAEDALTEDVNYEIKLNNSKILSILYVKNSTIPGSAHANNYLHSININIENGTILKFKDLINIDNNFVEKLKNVKNRIWTPKALLGIGATDEFNKELVGVIGDEFSDRDNKDLIGQFNSDDYSFYFTKDYFGMSIDVPHAVGDYAELEIKYNEIKDNIKPENEVWKGWQ